MLDISTSSKVTAMINLRKTGIFPYGRIYLNVDRTPREKYNYRPPGRRCSTPFPVPFFPNVSPEWRFGGALSASVGSTMEDPERRRGWECMVRRPRDLLPLVRQ